MGDDGPADHSGQWTYRVNEDEIELVNVRFFNREKPRTIHKEKTRVALDTTVLLKDDLEDIGIPSTFKYIKSKSSLSRKDPEIPAAKVGRFFGSFGVDSSALKVGNESLITDIEASKLDLLVSLVPSRVITQYIHKLEGVSEEPGSTQTLYFNNPDKFRGAVLFADVTKFSRTARRYHKENKSVSHAANIVACTVDRIFQDLVYTITRFGGDIIKFAGDGVLAAFDVKDFNNSFERTLEACTLVALECVGTEFIGAMNEDVYIHCGVGCGDIYCYHLGGKGHRTEYFLFGETAEQINITEVEASKNHQYGGLVVLSKESAKVLQEMNSDIMEGAVLIPKTKCYRLTTSAEDLKQVQGPDKLAQVHDMLNLVNKNGLDRLQKFLDFYVPEAVLTIPDVGNSHWSSETRTCSTMFIMLDGMNLAKASENDLYQLQTAITTVQTKVHKYDGSFLRFIVDDKGANMLVAFGLPPRKHETDGVRAIKCSLQLKETIEETSRGAITCRIGIASGKVFCGTVGGRVRREYTVHGTSVNLANNLMVEACRLKQGIFVDPKTHGEAVHAIAFKRRSHRVRDKGNDKRKMPAYTPKGSKVSNQLVSHSQGVFYGNDRVKIVLDEIMDLLAIGKTILLLVEGDPGVGKTECCKYVITNLRAGKWEFLNAGTIVARTDDSDRNTPYALWRNILVQFLHPQGISKGLRRETLSRVSEATRLEMEEQILKRYKSNGGSQAPGDVQALVSILLSGSPGKLSGVPNLAGKTRDLLETVAKGMKIIIIIEDLHLGDQQSCELIHELGKVRNTLFIVTYRQSRDRKMDEPDRIAVLRKEFRELDVPIEEVVLAPLRKQDVEKMVQSLVSLPKQPDARLLDYIYSRSGGNPRCVEALMLGQGLFEANEVILTARGEIMVEDGTVHFVAMPLAPVYVNNSVQKITVSTTALADHFAPSEKLALKVASVFGFEFNAQMLYNVLVVVEVPSDTVKADGSGYCAIEGDKDMVLKILNQNLKAFCKVGLLKEYDHKGSGLGDMYLFKDEVTRQIVYEMFFPSVRREMHKIVADLLEQIPKLVDVNNPGEFVCPCIPIKLTDSERTFQIANHLYLAEQCNIMASTPDEVCEAFQRHMEALEVMEMEGDMTNSMTCLSRLLEFSELPVLQSVFKVSRLDVARWKMWLGETFADLSRPDLSKPMYFSARQELNEATVKGAAEQDRKQRLTRDSTRLAKSRTLLRLFRKKDLGHGSGASWRDRSANM